MLNLPSVLYFPSLLNLRSLSGSHLSSLQLTCSLSHASHLHSASPSPLTCHLWSHPRSTPAPHYPEYLPKWRAYHVTPLPKLFSGAPPCTG